MKRVRLAGALLCAAVLAACGGGNDPARSIASARTYLDRHEPKAAIIELKNALQAAPDSPEARFLLGRALLVEGQPVTAAVELGKAAELKYPVERVLPPLARALNASGQWKKLIDERAGAVIADPAAAADFKVQLAVAHAALGNRPQVRA